ncbi:MAG: glycoside hydrolase family 20 zincin-like fold domain-containing protein [Verrucomicrobiia bacterium]
MIRAIAFLMFLAGSVLAASPVRVIPQPRDVSASGADFVLDGDAGVVLGRPDDEQDRFAAGMLCEELKTKLVGKAKRPILIGIANRDAAVRGACERRGLAVTKELGDEGYVLDVNADSVVAAANAPAGVFYAVQTLRQLVKRLPDGRMAIVGVRIRDWPGLRYRACQDDVSRGPVPTMEYFKKQIRTLAAFKINVFCLYTEHVFKFRKYPQIAPEGGEITAEQTRELIAYGKKHHVELLPQIQSFAHQAHILKHPEFAELREMQEGGHVFCPLNEGTYKLLADLYSEFVPVHEMKFFHVGCDETFELGKGRSKEKAAEIGVDGLYLQHMKRLREILKPYGKRLMFWGDIALHHKDIIPKLPKDYVVMNWTYGGATNYMARLEPFKAAGLDQWVCPGVSCWNQIFPNYVVARTNIAYFVRDGAAMGAQGMLNTAWDDDGENLTEYNWYGFLWSADCAWQPEQFDTARFDAAFAPVFYGVDVPELTEAVNLLGGLHSVLRAQQASDTVFWEDPFTGRRPAGADLTKRLQQIAELSGRVRTLIGQCRSKVRANEASLDAMVFAASRWGLLARKFLIADEIAAAYRRAADEPQNHRPAKVALRTGAARLRALATEVNRLGAEYRRLWLVENRPYYLDTITARYDALAARFEAKAQQLDETLAAYEETKLLPEPEKLGLGDRSAIRRSRAPEPLEQPKSFAACCKWWNADWAYRVLVKLEAGKYDRVDYPVEAALDFTRLLRAANNDGAFEPHSVRVVEHTADGALAGEVPSQFDPAAKFDAQQHAAGNVVWIARGRTQPKTPRYFFVYFDSAPKPAPDYSGLQTRNTWIENSVIKAQLGAEGGHAYVWQVKALGGLDITQPGERGWAGFLDVQGYRSETFALECEARGPVLVRYRMKAPDGFTKVVSFYGEQPWCEMQLSQPVGYCWNFDNAGLMSASCKTPGQFCFSNGRTGGLPKPGEVSEAEPKTTWGAKFRPDGLTLACITPDEPATHRAGPGGGMGGVGVEGAGGAAHFMVFGGVLDGKANVAKAMETLRRTMTLTNPPVLSITPVERAQLGTRAIKP